MNHYTTVLTELTAVLWNSWKNKTGIYTLSPSGHLLVCHVSKAYSTALRCEFNLLRNHPCNLERSSQIMSKTGNEKEKGLPCAFFKKRKIAHRSRSLQRINNKCLWLLLYCLSARSSCSTVTTDGHWSVCNLFHCAVVLNKCHSLHLMFTLTVNHVVVSINHLMFILFSKNCS